MLAPLLALALAAPAAPAPLPRPAPPPLTRADLAGAYSGTWCGQPIRFRLTADGGFTAFYAGEWWCGGYSLRGGAVYIREWRFANPAFAFTWCFRPTRGPNKKVRRAGYACH